MVRVMTSQPPATDVAVGRAVRGAIAATTLSRADVAEAMGISLRSMHRRILGELPFTVTELMTISKLCDVSLAELLARVERIASGDAA
jgi:hypothetical protein